MKRLSSFASLFTSLSTLVCCALPALFVVLGAGATFASLVGTFPHLIWLSERKVYFFVFGGIMLIAAGLLQYNARTKACPIDAKLGTACAATRDWSVWIYVVSLAIYLIGAAFAFVPQWLA